MEKNNRKKARVWCWLLQQISLSDRIDRLIDRLLKQRHCPPYGPDSAFP